MEEGLAALTCGAFHIRSGGRAYFNTTPLGRAVTGTLLVRAMHEDDVQIWGDGSTFKGNDIERFYRYGLLANPNLRIYKPWLDAAFVSELGGRREMSAWLLAHDLPVPRQRREGLLDRREHLGRDPRGQDPRAPRHRNRDGRADHGRAVLGPGGRDRAGGRHGRLRAGPPVTINGARFDTPVDLVMAANEVGGRHGLGMSDQIENRIIEAKSRGIYEAPGMALLLVAYERLLNAIHNEDTIANYHTEGRRLGRLLYEGRWLDPQALMLRESLQRWVGSHGHRRGHPAAAPRRGLLDPATPPARRSATTPTSCRWSAPRTRRSARWTGSASSPCATSTSPTRAPSSSSTRDSGWSAPPTSS